MGTSTIKSLYLLAVQNGVSKVLNSRATELCKLHPFVVKAIQKFFPIDLEARSWYYKAVSRISSQ